MNSVEVSAGTRLLIGVSAAGSMAICILATVILLGNSEGGAWPFVGASALSLAIFLGCLTAIHSARERLFPTKSSPVGPMLAVVGALLALAGVAVGQI